MGDILVGRATELTVIRAATQTGETTGRPVAIAISGAAGLGKTRLVEEIRNVTNAERRFSLIGYEPERSVPFGAAQPLIAATRRRDEGDLNLATGGPAHDTAKRWLDPVRLFEATHQSLRGSGRVLLTLDDVQWMDEASIALCHYLLRAAEAESSRLTIVVSARPSSVASELTESMARAVGDPARFALIELEPLEQSAGVELIMSLAPGTDEERAAELWALAGGSPFWMTAISRAGSTAASTTARLRRLEPDASRLLALLAVGGRPVREADLERQLGWPADRFERAAEPLRSSGLATRADQGMQVAHDLIRAAATREIPDDLRPRLHRMVAADLEDHAGEDVRLLRAAMEHRQAASDPVLDVATRIASSPGRRWLGSDGVRDLVAVSDAADPLDPRTPTLDEGIGALAADLGDHARALERFSRASDRHTDPVARARTALGAARAAQGLGLATETRAFLDRARLASDAPWVAIEAMAVEAGLLLWTEHRPMEGLRLGRDAAEAAREAIGAAPAGSEHQGRLRDALLGALQATFDGALQTQDLPELDRVADEMIDVGSTAGPEAYLRALHNGGVAMRHVGRYREAARRYHDAWNGARHETLPMLAVESGTGAVICLLRLGQLDEARAVATEVDALYERMGRPRIHQVRPTRAIREVALSTGDWRRAVSELERDILEEPDPHYRLSTHQLLAVWLSRIGGVGAVDDVVRHVTVGRQDAEAAGCPRCAAELDLRSAEALARVGRPDAAVAHLLRQRTADPSRPLERAYRRWIAGLEAGSSDAAVATLSETLEDLTSLGLGLEGIWLRLDLARALEPSDRAAAIAQLRSAMQLAGERGARTEQKHADQELRRLGARTWRRGAASRSTGRGDLEVLSDREVEIARAAAAGASNPEIAEQLFLSRRTVEHHLSSILRKLDLRNRTELASIVALRGDGPGVEGRSD